MKKKIALLLTLIMVTFALSACGKFTCDLCGQEKSGRKYETTIFDTDITICQDCYDNINSLFN